MTAVLHRWYYSTVHTVLHCFNTWIVLFTVEMLSFKCYSEIALCRIGWRPTCASSSLSHAIIHCPKWPFARGYRLVLLLSHSRRRNSSCLTEGETVCASSKTRTVTLTHAVTHSQPPSPRHTPRTLINNLNPSTSK